jgi:vancomycin resistance protein YoaR
MSVGPETREPPEEPGPEEPGPEEPSPPREASSGAGEGADPAGAQPDAEDARAVPTPPSPTPPRLSLGRTLTVLLLSAAIGSALGLLVLPRAATDPSGEGLPEVRYLGAPLSLDRGAIDVALNRTRTFAKQSVSVELPDGKFHSIALSRLGAEIDTVRLTNQVLDARDPSSRTRSLWRELALGRRAAARDDGVDRSHDLPVPISLDPEQSLLEILRLKDKVDRSARDARLDLEHKTVLPHVTGRSLDVDRTLRAIDLALERGQLRAKAAISETEPNRRSQSLAGLSFERVLGHFETHYSTADKDRDRTFNLHLAASKLDGTVLLPGEIFDFNLALGARDEANGYRVATVIADGELVDGIGGGTCQISGTLHGAVFFAGLSIVERYPHTRPSSYIKMGMDATVVYPTINFRVQNTFSFPVVLHQTVRGGIVHAEVLGPEVDQVVTLIRRIDEALPYEQIERSDDRLPRGTRLLGQRGIPGFRLHRYRIIRQGSHTLRERWRDIYPPTTQVIRVGTGPPNLDVRGSDVRVPEYLADELLVLTQKRPEGGRPAEFAENREAGRFGEEGWTARAGMPLWQDQAITK